MNKSCFLDIFKTAMDIEDIEFIGVKVQQENGFEIIIFDREMFESKYNYYNNAYNENMELKACNKIKIVNIDFGNQVSRIPGQLIKSWN